MIQHVARAALVARASPLQTIGLAGPREWSSHVSALQCDCVRHLIFLRAAFVAIRVSGVSSVLMARLGSILIQNAAQRKQF